MNSGMVSFAYVFLGFRFGFCPKMQRLNLSETSTHHNSTHRYVERSQDRHFLAHLFTKNTHNTRDDLFLKGILLLYIILPHLRDIDNWQIFHDNLVLILIKITEKVNATKS